MDLPTRQLIEAIHHSPRKCVLVLAGGGTGALARLLSVPGGSRTVLEAVVPYGEQALAEFLGGRPEQFCSSEASARMAARAYDRAGWLAPGESVIGLGCTATLATDRPKRGDHRVHLSVKTDDETLTLSLTLQKGARARAGEEAVVNAALLNALAEACQLSERLPLPLVAGETPELTRHPRQDLLHAVLRGTVTAVCLEPDGRMRPLPAAPGAVLSGAFNPMHHGHWQLAGIAARRTGLPVAFELSATNVDKPPLELAEVRRRAGQFAGRAPLWVTRAPTFAEKAALFPGSVFVVGADTAERIVHPRYYEGREDLMAAALEQARSHGCRFLVAGREDASGRFVGGADVAIPSPCADLFETIAESEFRVLVSSTRLREQARAAGIDRPPASP